MELELDAFCLCRLSRQQEISLEEIMRAVNSPRELFENASRKFKSNRQFHTLPRFLQADITVDTHSSLEIRHYDRISRALLGGNSNEHRTSMHKEKKSTTKRRAMMRAKGAKVRDRKPSQTRGL